MSKIEAGIPAQTILEIGHGSIPAVSHGGGSIFQTGNARYYGIDLPFEYNGRKRKKNEEEGNNIVFVVGDAAALPFQDNTMNTVLMRSVFGQFTERAGNAPYHLENIRSGALFESFRVLKPGGQLIIFEENTPEQKGLVESWVQYAGFIPTQLLTLQDAFENLPEDDTWRTLRGLYFSETTAQHLWPGGYFNDPYILVSEKPEKPTYEECAGYEAYRVNGQWKNIEHTYTKGIPNENPSISDTPIDYAW